MKRPSVGDKSRCLGRELSGPCASAPVQMIGESQSQAVVQGFARPSRKWRGLAQSAQGSVHRFWTARAVHAFSDHAASAV